MFLVSAAVHEAANHEWVEIMMMAPSILSEGDCIDINT